jgi:hypothetical protein
MWPFHSGKGVGLSLGGQDESDLASPATRRANACFHLIDVRQSKGCVNLSDLHMSSRLDRRCRVKLESACGYDGQSTTRACMVSEDPGRDGIGTSWPRAGQPRRRPLAFGCSIPFLRTVFIPPGNSVACDNGLTINLSPQAHYSSRRIKNHSCTTREILKRASHKFTDSSQPVILNRKVWTSIKRRIIKNAA